MTQEERIELLRKVAEVAPEGCRGEYRDLPYEEVVLKIDRGNTERWVALGLYDEYEDAEAVIAMLDAMEEDGYFPMLYGNGESYVCSNALYADNCIPTQSKTRAEAVARAFVEVFKK